MAIFRVEKNRNYVTMSNYHLRDKNLSLKAKGLLSQILSLPPDWDYSLAGLASINKEKIDAIRTAIQELERFGYLKRERIRFADGRLGGAEYIVYEQPTLDFPTQDKITEKTDSSPTLDFPTQVKSTQKKTMQLNKEIPIKEKQKKDSFREIGISIKENFHNYFGRNPDVSFVTTIIDRLKDTDTYNLSIEQVIEIIKKASNRNPKKPEAYILGTIKRNANKKQEQNDKEKPLEDWEIEWYVELMEYKKKNGEPYNQEKIDEYKKLLDEFSRQKTEKQITAMLANP